MKPAYIMLLLFVLSLFLKVPLYAREGDKKFEVKSDPRVELLSVVFMLAGNEEYNMATQSPYKEDINKYFGKYKDHEAVKLAIEYRQEYGISFDAVMSMAVHIKDINSLKARIPFAGRPEKFDKRWSPETGENFLNALRKFVTDTGFEEFIRQHASFYSETEKRLETTIRENASLEWYDLFFGKRETGKFILVPGYLTGGGNYGVGFKDQANGIDELYSITSFGSVDANGIPLFYKSIIPTVIHEFCHSYVNPVVYKHSGELKEAGEKIFPLVASSLKRQAYSGWETMMVESVVRACVNRYLRKNSTNEEVLRDIRNNIERGFIWIEELDKLFDEYENNRNKYAGLDDFFPNIVKFFNDYSGVIEEKLEIIKKNKEARLQTMKEKGPKIVSVTPADGENNADPAVQYIIITFDRAMTPGSYSINYGSKTFPDIQSKPSYENDNKVLKLKVKLLPDTEYDYWLNTESTLGFKSKENIPLYPVHIQFKTR